CALPISYGQEEKTTNNKEFEQDQEIDYDSYNRWSFEATVGQSKGIKPYQTGYYSSDPSKVFGRFQANSFGAGVRYMISPKFGVKASFNYDKFTNDEGSGSLDFETYQYRGNFEGVINAVRLFNI